MQLDGFKYCCLTLIMLFNIIHLFAQLNGFKCRKRLNIFIWPVDGIRKVLLLQVKVNLKVMKRYSTFPKLQDWSLNIRYSLMSFPENLLAGVTLLQSAYSIAPADCAVLYMSVCVCVCIYIYIYITHSPTPLPKQDGARDQFISGV